MRFLAGSGSCSTLPLDFLAVGYRIIFFVLPPIIFTSALVHYICLWICTDISQRIMYEYKILNIKKHGYYNWDESLLLN